MPIGLQNGQNDAEPHQKSIQKVFQKWDVLSIDISSKKRKVDKYMMTGLCSTETDYKIIKVDFPPSVISVYFH